MAILECRELTKYFDSSRALDHVSLTVEPGRIVGLLGPNGSGKTTLIKLANGLLVPSSGTVTIDGHTPGPETKGLISYLPERTYLSGWMNVVQLLDFFGDFYPDFDRDAAEHMLSALDVSPRLRIKQMSKGTREKVQLILVMSRRTRLYLLDEPIGGVDPATRDYIIHTILTNFNPDSTAHLHPPHRRRGADSGRRGVHQPGSTGAAPVRGPDPAGAWLQRRRSVSGGVPLC